MTAKGEWSFLCGGSPGKTYNNNVLDDPTKNTYSHKCTRKKNWVKRGSKVSVIKEQGVVSQTYHMHAYKCIFSNKILKGKSGTIYKTTLSCKY